MLKSNKQARKSSNSQNPKPESQEPFVSPSDVFLSLTHSPSDILDKMILKDKHSGFRLINEQTLVLVENQDT